MRVRHREGAKFVNAVMKRVGAENPTDLSKIMGPPWTERDQQRRLYKWASGENAPDFLGTLSLLHAAGLFSMQELYEGAAVEPRQAPDEPPDDIAAVVAAVSKEMRSGFQKIDRRLQGLELQRTAEEDRSPPKAREA